MLRILDNDIDLSKVGPTDTSYIKMELEEGNGFYMLRKDNGVWKPEENNPLGGVVLEVNKYDREARYLFKEKNPPLPAAEFVIDFDRNPGYKMPVDDVIGVVQENPVIPGIDEEVAFVIDRGY